MQAIQMHETGGPEVLRLVELPVPVPGPGQVLIKIAATGVNFIETYFREGRYQAPLPLIPGSEAAGIVAAVGEGVAGFAIGDAVASVAVGGSYAEFALVPAAALVKVPAGLDLKLAAAALLQGMTAHYLVYSTHPLKAGETCLIHAAAGGTGQMLVQMAARIGARVLATVSTEAKAELARAAGADEVILYNDVDFAAEARRLTDGRGVDVVYDTVGQATFEGSLKSLRSRGLLALVGGASGAVPPIDLIRLSTMGSLFVTRPTLKDYIATRAELEWRAEAVFAGLLAGELKVRADHVYPLAEAAQAQIDIASRKTTGKLLLIP
jgi:NADPH2:quinone reductase